MSLLAALAIYSVFLAIYWFFVLSVLWHLREYILPIDYSSLITKGFLGIMIMLNAIALILFFQLPLHY